MVTPSNSKTVRENSVGWMLKKIASHMDQQMSQKLKTLDLTINQFAVIMTLLEEEGLSQTRIGQKISMPGYATTRTIDALEEQNLVERRKDTNSRRSHLIYLTNTGKKLAPDLFSVVGDVNKNLLDVLDKKETGDLINSLKKILTSAK